MAVPAHDERDFEFAKKCNLPIREVIEPMYIATSGSNKVLENLPNLKYFVAKNPGEVKNIILETYRINSPCYVRI